MKINILVTAIGGGGVGRQIIKALKLSNINYNLFGADITEISFGKEDVNCFTILPKANEFDYIDKILKYCLDNEIVVVFPGSENELEVLSKHLDMFDSKGIYIPINNEDLIRLCSDKFMCNNFLKENGFQCPISFLIEEFDDLDKVDFFPVVLKPVTGSGGSSNVLIAQNKSELETFVNYLLINKIKVIVQEYIGHYRDEFTVGVLHSKEGKLINSIVLNRDIGTGLGFNIGVINRTGKKELGDRLIISSGLSQGKFVKRSFINEVCEELASKLGSISTINIQGRIHNGKFYIFEINPRFSGTTSSRSIVGFNEPEILINEKINDIRIPRNFPYNVGYVYRGLDERLIKI